MLDLDAKAANAAIDTGAAHKPALRTGAVIEPRCRVAKIGTAATPPKCPASRNHFADLPSKASELEQTKDFRRLVAVLLGDDRDARGVAAGIDLDPDRLNIAPDAVLQENREGVAAMHTAAREQQASPLRFLAFV
jgi:hypothetical protein